MKTNLCVSFLCLLTILMSYGQKCKPKYSETDDFTEVKTEYWGNTLTSMSVYSLGVQYAPSLYVFKENNENKIIIGLSVRGKLDKDMVLNNHTWFEKGSKFLIKLENELLEFIVERSSVNQSRYTTVEIISSISTEQLEKLNSQKMEKGRVYPFIDNNDMIFQFKISQGRDKVIKKQISCFLKL